MTKAKQLKNGMRFHLVPFDGTEAVTVLVLIDVGSRYESSKVLGASHVIEHMMFKGTEKRPTNLDISKELDRYGAQFNAYTGKDITGYYVKIASDKAPIAIDLLHDMLFNSKFEAKDLKREKKVIVEEIKMYEENPIMHIKDLIEETMFEGTSLGLNIAGTTDTVLNMRRADILKYKEDNYQVERMVVVLAGAVPKNTKALLEKSFGKVEADKRDAVAYETISDRFETEGLKLKSQYKPLKQIQLALGFPTFGREHKDAPALRILSMILGGTMSSRLFMEVREKKALCYYIGSQVSFYEDVGKFIIQAGLDASRLDDAVKTVLKELRKIKKHGVTQEELRYTKDHIGGAMRLGLENSSARAEFYGRQELHRRSMKTPEERLEELNAVKRSDIKRVANQILDTKKLSVAGIGPYKKDKDLAKHFEGLL
ncbi:insulinase family protein [Candidatus Uhrbacteria bacterium]|jgi:predicted Zn-dependent peptidase|nr:insulinase family protein [Candidatus Uhrbacteria bacterium]MBT7716937.1 insulinase family protein [Candidatus Uhrbacteria bacterium]